MKALETSSSWIVPVVSKSVTGVLIRGEELEVEAGGTSPRPRPPEAERSKKDPPQSLQRESNLGTP